MTYFGRVCLTASYFARAKRGVTKCQNRASDPVTSCIRGWLNAESRHPRLVTLELDSTSKSYKDLLAGSHARKRTARARAHKTANATHLTWTFRAIWNGAKN